MATPIFQIFLAFIEGFALIISPCILPILPIMLSGSLTGSRMRPVGIVVGFIFVFTLVTLLSHVVLQSAHLNQNMLRYASLVILFLLGIMMFSTKLSDKFNQLTQRLTQIGSSNKNINNPEGGFVSGVFLGSLVGIIWTPCAGPILAAVIVQVVLQNTTVYSVLILFAFAVGVGLPMLLIALLGRKLLHYFSFFRNKTVFFRKFLGVIIMASALYLAYDPTFAFSFKKSSTTSNVGKNKLIDAIQSPYLAPPITGITAWINSPPVDLATLKNKVVLIDFWTYSCINCIRTLSYLKNWYAQYHDKGLVIIGVHSPEFPFEHDLNNVKQAVERDKILYPIALDNAFNTWQNYHNQYWPAHFLINKKGQVVYQHFGEGDYDITENNIRFLLGLSPLSTTHNEESYAPLSQTPEIYLGHERSINFSNSEPSTENLTQHYHYPDELSVDHWALQGQWQIKKDKIISAEANSTIKLFFNAQHVYAVMGASHHPITVYVTLNGKTVTESAGKDVKNGTVTVKGERLYSLITLPKSGEAILELRVKEPGLTLYTFTFG